MDTIIVIGSCGFMGSNFSRAVLASGHRVINLDDMTCAASPLTLAELEAHLNHPFMRGSIGDRRLLSELSKRHHPSRLVNLAAETLVDRSIDELAARGDGRSHAERIRHVSDRPVHDRRCALGAREIEAELRFYATVGLNEGLRGTVAWYLRNWAWWSDLMSRGYAPKRSGLGTPERVSRP